MNFTDACNGAAEMAEDFGEKVVVLHAPQEVNEPGGAFTFWPERNATMMVPTGRVVSFRLPPFKPSVAITARTRSRTAV